MKKILCALISIFYALPSVANIHINPDAVVSVIAEYFPNAQADCIREYNAQLKASDGAGIAAVKLWNICTVGGLDIKKTDDKATCKTFVNNLVQRGTIKFYAVCGNDKNTAGAICVNDFMGLTVNMLQAQGLARLYAKNKSDNTIQCRTKPRIQSTTTQSINPNAMGMSSTTNTPYVQCTSHNSNKFYEFRFLNIDGNIDSINHKNFKTGICKIFGSKFASKNLYGHTWDICSDVANESDCNKIKNTIGNSNIGYNVSWGPAGYTLSDKGYQITNSSLPYCIISEDVALDSNGALLFEKTAFGLDGRVFLNAGIQRKGSQEVKNQIRAYVENTMGRENVKSFSCEDTYHTVKLKNRSGTDDMLRCTINGETVEFFFDDLSEWWDKYDKSGREAMSCITWGGTFTGKKCIGLDEQMCNVVRDANKELCPECALIKWNGNACELPASVSATNLKKGLNYSAIVGGAVVGVVITVGTLGSATAPTAVILTGLAIETLGAGIELKAQIDIDNKADKFFTHSENCKSESCAVALIDEYLIELGRTQRDLTDAEANALDQEMARLIGLIPTGSDWWMDSLRNEDGTSFLERADDGKMTAAQVWRAVGIGMQFTGVATSVVSVVLRKLGWLQKSLLKTTKILEQNAKIAQKYIVKAENLSGADKEWYRLWREYAPKNQTFAEFKEMTDGDLNKMREMSKNWLSRGEKKALVKNIDEQIDEFKNVEKTWNETMDKYGIDALPLNLDEREALFKEYPDVKKAWDDLSDFYGKRTYEKLENSRNFYSKADANYATYDPEFADVHRQYSEKYDNIQEQIKIELNKYIKDNPSKSLKDFIQTSTYKKLVKQGKPISGEYNRVIAEQFPLKELGNVANERADDFFDIIQNNPEFNSMVNGNKWRTMTNNERLQALKDVMDKYAVKTGTPKANVEWDYDLPFGVRGYYESGKNTVFLNPNQSRSNVIGTLSHEHGHFIDDLVPSEGAVGEQIFKNTDRFYSNQWRGNYRLTSQEQSSFEIGSTVKSKVMNTPKKIEETVNEFHLGAAAGIGTSGIEVTKGVKASVKEKQNKKHITESTNQNEEQEEKK